MNDDRFIALRPKSSATLLSLRLALLLALSFAVSCPAWAQTAQTRALPHGGSTQLSSPSSLCLYEIELSRRVVRSPRFAYYSLLPEKPEHTGQRIDVFVGFRLESSPDQWWLLAGGDTPAWSKYAAGKDPVAYLDNVLLTPSPWNAFPIDSAPSDASMDLNAAIANGSIYIGYGLRGAANGSLSASFQEMLDNRRMGRIWFSVHDDVEVCLRYSKIRAKAAASARSQ